MAQKSSGPLTEDVKSGGTPQSITGDATPTKRGSLGPNGYPTHESKPTGPNGFPIHEDYNERDVPRDDPK